MMTAKPPPADIVPTETGYRGTCPICGWSREYRRRRSARSGLSAHKCRERSHAG